MTDIYKEDEKLWQTVIGEIEGQNIKPDEIYTRDKLTLDQEQMSPVKVEKADTFRGGTELINPRKFELQFEEHENRTTETIMFGAQTAKQSQRKYQDSMKGNPNSGVNARRRDQSDSRSKKTRLSKPMLRIGRSSKVKTEFSNGRS